MRLASSGPKRATCTPLSRTGSLAFLTVAVLAISCSQSPSSSLSSTYVGGGAGSFFGSDPVPAVLAEFAEFAVQGKIIRIEAAHFNTPSGEWEGIGPGMDVHDQYVDLRSFTTVVIEVSEVVAIRPGLNFEVPKVVEIDILGGEKEFSLTLEEALLIGVDRPISNEEENEVLESGQDPDSVDLTPTEPMTLLKADPNAVLLFEGDEVIAFVRRSSYASVGRDGRGRIDVLTAPEIGGVGIYRKTSEGVYSGAVHQTIFKESDLLRWAEQVVESDQIARDPNSKAGFSLETLSRLYPGWSPVEQTELDPHQSDVLGHD